MKYVFIALFAPLFSVCAFAQTIPDMVTYHTQTCSNQNVMIELFGPGSILNVELMINLRMQVELAPGVVQPVSGTHTTLIKGQAAGFFLFRSDGKVDKKKFADEILSRAKQFFGTQGIPFYPTQQSMSSCPATTSTVARR